MNSKLVQGMVLVGLLCAPVRGAAQTQSGGPPTQEITDPATVRTAQRALRDKDLYSGPINGVVEEETRRALLRFQEQAGIDATGMVDRPTLIALGILEDDRGVLKKTGEGAVHTAKTAGDVTLTGVTAAGKSTAKGVTVAGATTARGATTALNGTAHGLEAAGKGVAKGSEATLDTAATVGKTTSGGARKAGLGLTDFLGISKSDDKIRRQILKKLDRDPLLQDSQARIFVEKGVVTLTLAGGSPQQYDRAAAIARAVKGVKDVVVLSP